jgi:hypothetical protein
MSDDEEDFHRYKYKNKNNISEEDEEELEDEIEKNSKDNSNQKKDSKISDTIDNNSIKKENENEDNNTKEENDDKNEDDNTPKNKDEYLALIEQLENELKLEQNINIQLKDNMTLDEITKLKTDLNQKTDLLDRLIITNKKQNSALNMLTRKLNEENKKKLKLKTQETQESNSREESERSNINISKAQAVNIVLKVKEKELHNALNKLNALKSENEALKKILYENVDYKNNIEDKSKEINDKIEQYTNEKNLLIKQLKEHKKCLDERKKYNDDYNNLKEELKQIKKNIQNIRGQARNLINEKNGINLTVTNNNINNMIKSPKNNEKKTALSLSPRRTKANNKNKKGIILPLITSQIINKSQNLNEEESILTDEFKKKVKEYLNNDEDESTILIEKINNIEKSRKKIENKHKNELKQFNTQIKALDEQFKLLNSNSKGSNSNIRVLRYQLNTIKGNNRLDAKKIIELKKELQSKIDVSKEKDYEISILIGKINSLKNLANYGNIEIPRDDISDFINKIKQENQYIDVYKNDKEEGDNEDKNTKDGRKKIYLKNEGKNIAEESIQADFSESNFEDEK